MQPSENVKSVERAFQILNCFTLETPELGITELSKKLKVSKSTIHRLVVSMQNQGFLTKNKTTQQYKLGFGVLRLSEVVLNNLNIRDIALPYLQELRDKTGETTGLNIISNTSRVCIEKAESHHDLRRFIEIGQSLPLYAGASGKILLAYQDKQFITKVLNESALIKYTDKTITNPVHILEDLQSIKKKGYCITYGEHVAGVTSISAPIFDHNNKIVASINISGPNFRFTPNKNKEFLELLLEATKNISKHIGYRK